MPLHFQIVSAPLCTCSLRVGWGVYSGDGVGMGTDTTGMEWGWERTSGDGWRWGRMEMGTI